jgi:hypothetical protein
MGHSAPIRVSDDRVSLRLLPLSRLSRASENDPPPGGRPKITLKSTPDRCNVHAYKMFFDNSTRSPPIRAIGGRVPSKEFCAANQPQRVIEKTQNPSSIAPARAGQTPGSGPHPPLDRRKIGEFCGGDVGPPRWRAKQQNPLERAGDWGPEARGKMRRTWSWTTTPHRSTRIAAGALLDLPSPASRLQSHPLPRLKFPPAIDLRHLGAIVGVFLRCETGLEACIA